MEGIKIDLTNGKTSLFLNKMTLDHKEVSYLLAILYFLPSLNRNSIFFEKADKLMLKFIQIAKHTRMSRKTIKIKAMGSCSPAKY